MTRKRQPFAFRGEPRWKADRRRWSARLAALHEYRAAMAAEYGEDSDKLAAADREIAELRERLARPSLYGGW